ASLPALDFIAALGTLVQMAFELMSSGSVSFAKYKGDPLFAFRMFHKTQGSFGRITGLGLGWENRIGFSLGSRMRLNRASASAIREFTVPSGISSTSAILASFMSS